MKINLKRWKIVDYRVIQSYNSTELWKQVVTLLAQKDEEWVPYGKLEEAENLLRQVMVCIRPRTLPFAGMRPRQHE